jgi:acetyl esterase/lipase
MHSLGVAVVLPSYRLSSQAPFPAAFDDLTVALRWIRDNATDCNLDPARCLLFGGSAGGHLAMLLATRSGEFKGTLPDIRGVVQYCGIMDAADQYDFDSGRQSAMTRNFLGGIPAELPELYRQASPIHNIPHTLPPIWMAHGSSDACVPFRQSARFADALRAAGHNPIFHEARELGHTMIEMEPTGGAVMPYRALFQSDLSRFIQRCLFPAQAAG